MSQPFPQRRPLLFIGLLLFLILGIFLITFAVTALGHWPVTAASLISEILLGLVAVFLLSRFQWWHVAGFRMPRYSPAFLCLLAPCFVLVTDANTVSQYWDYLPGRNNALFFAIFAMLVGFVEENYFRWADTAYSPGERAMVGSHRLVRCIRRDAPVTSYRRTESGRNGYPRPSGRRPSASSSPP